MVSQNKIHVSIHIQISRECRLRLPPLYRGSRSGFRRVPAGQQTHQRLVEHIFAAPARHALIVDTTTIVRVPDAGMRRQMKEFEDSKRPIIREKNIGSAIIIQNTLVRGAYTALRWISPQPAPNKAFSTMEAAARWCVQGIEGDGQVVPIAAYAMAGLANKTASG